VGRSCGVRDDRRRFAVGPSPFDGGPSIVGGRPLAATAFWPRSSSESDCLGMQSKAGGKFHLRLNTGTSPIANKYREGKLKRTLKREFNST
jgi:hypothetical protein